MQFINQKNHKFRLTSKKIVKPIYQHVLDTHRGLSPQLSQQTIHEAFRSLHAADIAAIYRRQLSPTEQSALLCQAEIFHRNRVECFMTWIIACTYKNENLTFNP